MIYSRNKTIKIKDAKKRFVEYEVVTLKVQHKDAQTYLIQYILDKNQELSSLVSSKGAEVFYNSNFDFMAADLKTGVVDL